MQICVQEPSGRGERESAAPHTEARSLNPSRLILWDHLRGGLTPWKMRSPSLGEMLVSHVQNKGNADPLFVLVNACMKTLHGRGIRILVTFCQFSLKPACVFSTR